MRILYFLEDRAQEGFIKALIERIVKEESISVGRLIHDVRSARGGSRIIKEFKNLIKDTTKSGAMEIDLLVVTIDGNCKGHMNRVKELEKHVQDHHPLKGRIVYAVLDPHIERWYLMDQRALREGVGLNKVPDMPSYKCEKAYYKKVLNQALKESDVDSLLGGAEYAERIVDNIESFELLSRQNTGFKFFVENLRSILRSRMGNS